VIPKKLFPNPIRGAAFEKRIMRHAKGHVALTTDVLAERLVRGTRGRSAVRCAALSNLRHKGKEKPMTKAVKSAATAVALKAERERDKAQALQDYQDDQRARQAKERADAKKAAAPRTASS
jgi:hypothetical protein